MVSRAHTALPLQETRNLRYPVGRPTRPWVRAAPGTLRPREAPVKEYPSRQCLDVLLYRPRHAAVFSASNTPASAPLPARQDPCHGISPAALLQFLVHGRSGTCAVITATVVPSGAREHPNPLTAQEEPLQSTLESHHAPVAQLDRASVYGTEGYTFESCRAYLT